MSSIECDLQSRVEQLEWGDIVYSIAIHMLSAAVVVLAVAPIGRRPFAALGVMNVLCLCGGSVALAQGPEATPSDGRVTQARVLSARQSGADWLVNGADFGETHYSPLKQITADNIGRMGLAWSLDVDSAMGLAVEPIVVDGIIYVSASGSRVFAIDARSGHIRWQYDPKVPLSNTRHSYYARTNKGVAVWDGRVFVGTGDCRLIALDAGAGRELWQAPVCADVSASGISGAPRVGGGRIYMGYAGGSGGGSGSRGSVVAFDAVTGRTLWRAWNIPGDPSKGFENKTMEMAAATWPDHDWWPIEGGGVWEPITYDPETNLVLYGTQDEEVDYGAKRKAPNSERLFTNCIIAVRADTGELAWYVPTWKYLPAGYAESPENFHILVTNLTIAGRNRHVALTVPRFGGFFVIDVKSGQVISEKPLSDRPAAQLSSPASNGAPRSATGHNWWPMSYSPSTGLVYIPAYDDVMDSHYGEGRTAVGRLIAWDAAAQSARWSVQQQFPYNGGVLSTEGGAVFQGQGTGEFAAYDSRSGRKLWSLNTGSAIESIPVTYIIDNEQYVLLAVGFGSASRLWADNGTMATRESRLGPSRLYAFKLGANVPFPYPKVTVPRVPEPPAQTASDEVIRQGQTLANQYECWGCHGGEKLEGSGAWILNGSVPDLRYMPSEVHAQFSAIVLGGMRRQFGMPGFADGQRAFDVSIPHMTAEEANAIHAYIVSLQWKAYEAQQGDQMRR